MVPIRREHGLRAGKRAVRSDGFLIPAKSAEPTGTFAVQVRFSHSWGSFPGPALQPSAPGEVPNRHRAPSVGAHNLQHWSPSSRKGSDSRNRLESTCLAAPGRAESDPTRQSRLPFRAESPGARIRLIASSRGGRIRIGIEAAAATIPWPAMDWQLACRLGASFPIRRPNPAPSALSVSDNSVREPTLSTVAKRFRGAAAGQTVPVGYRRETGVETDPSEHWARTARLLVRTCSAPSPGSS